MKKGSITISLFVFFSAIFSVVNAQKFDSVLQVLDTRYPQEKLYLHFDRSNYNPGETIWFKAYIFNANLPSHISRTVYSELLDDKGKVIDRKVSPVVSSSAAAAFDLPSTYSAGMVYVRAYTDWMLNFDSSFLYYKAIPILQYKKSTAKAPEPKTFLQFFPEGGDMVEGLESRVAFKATDIRGLPYNIKGDITNSKGQSVATFTSIHDGMGFFTLTYDPKETYKANFKDAAGKLQQTLLPFAKKSGLVVKIEQEKGEIQFTISTPASEVKPVNMVYVVGQVQQQLVYMANANLSKTNTVRGKIPTENIPAGLLQLTIFSQDQKPLAERLVFVNKQDYYFITDLNSPLKGFEKRKKNVIQIDVPDTIKTNLSIAITDASLNLPGSDEDDIFSGVLLTSDIKGYVHNPAYYFSSEADSVVSHLDLVMMTNGWRRFKWEDVLVGKYPKIAHLPSNYISIIGKINGLTRTQLASQELTGIMEVDKKQQFLTIPVDPTGSFNLPGLLFFDTAKLFYQFNKDKEKVLTSRASFTVKSNLLTSGPGLRVDSTASQRFILPPDDILLKNSDLARKNNELAEQLKRVETLASVTVTAKQVSKKDQMDKDYTSGLFSGGDGYTFITEDDPFALGAQSVLQYLQGKVAGLQITGQGTQMTMSWRGGTPTLFLNEMTSDVEMIQSMSMADVAMVKVFRPPFFGAPGGGSGGAVAIYTKKGAALNKDVKGLDFAKIAGYSVPREFYSPDYSKYDDRHTMADYRPTLYWNPFVLTDKNSRRILFTFYNNDITKKFRVIIEGCNIEGKLTRIEKTFQ
ncbi:MAG: hypothetical protein ABI415_01045 [Flavitalea sp.]